MKIIFQIISDSIRMARKDLLDFSRDRMQLVFFIIMPIFMMIMTGFIFPTENSLKNIPLGIANQDTGQLSQTLTQVLTDLKTSDNNQVFEIKTYADSSAIKDAIKAQKINGGLYIDSDFSQMIQQGQPAEVSIIPDQSNPQISQILTQLLQQVIAGTSTNVAQAKVGEIIKLTAMANPQLSQADPATIIQPIQSTIDNLIPGKPNYFQFVAPGIMALIVMMSVMTGLAVSVTREREAGTLDGLLIAPVSRLAIILGKAFSQTVRGLVQGMVVLLLAILIFGVHVYGNWLIMIVLMILGVFAFMGIGILVSAVASAQESAMTIMMTFQFPMMFLSGTFFPIQQMPQVMQYISKAIPLTYEASALRKVIVLGAGFNAVWTETLILFVFGAIMLAIAVPTFRRVITR
ncbi:MAG: ABC transporter permease [Patescibacteria group bacterium]|nr:ABC transporter permease [Patescibacteria group bacterium]